jgi:hypothetical protein
MVNLHFLKKNTFLFVEFKKMPIFVAIIENE